jgi:hypothetical protein
MKKLFIGFLLLQCAFACNNDKNHKAPASENDVDAARNFIRAALDGKWNDARKFMLQDSVNVQLLETAESKYKTKEREDKRGYRESSINLYDTRELNDSTSVINYSNSYMNKRDSLKVVRIGGQWLIDLKYSLLPTDTTHVH